MEKTLTQDIKCEEEEKLLDYVATSDKGDPQIMDDTRDSSNPSGDGLPLKAVKPTQNEKDREMNCIPITQGLLQISLPGTVKKRKTTQVEDTQEH